MKYGSHKTRVASQGGQGRGIIVLLWGEVDQQV